MAATASKIPEESKSDIKPDLEGIRGQEGIYTNSAGKGRGGSSSSTGSRPAKMSYGDKDKQESPGGLKDSEENGGNADGDSSEDDDGQGGLWSGDNDNSTSTGGTTKKRFKITRKKAAAGATGAFIIGITGFGTISITQGPMQLIHAAEILQKPLISQEDNSESRLRGMLRFARSGEIGETRVSWYGSRSAAKTLERLKKVGFTIEKRQPGSKRPTVIKVDTSKFEPGFTTQEAALKFADSRGIPHEYIFFDVLKSNRAGGTFWVKNPKGGPIPDPIAIKALDTAVRRYYEGKMMGKFLAAVKVRPVLKYNGNWNKLHPWKKLTVRTQEAAAAFEIARQEKRAERNAIAKERAEKIKSKLKPAGTVTGVASWATLGMCVAKDIAGEVPLINYENVKMPSANVALDIISQGAAIKAMNKGDFDIRQIGESTKSLYDKDGKSIFQGKAFNALAYNSAGDGTDLDPDVKKSYSNEMSAANIEGAIDANGGNIICSVPGQVGLGVLGLVSLVAAAPSDGSSVLAYAATVTALTAGTMAIVSAVTAIVPQLVADKPLLATQEYLAGPQGGNVAAYGSELFAGDTSRKSGGIELSEAETAIIDKKLRQKDQNEFQSKSMVARVFDIKDYRSLTSRTLNSTDINASQGVASLTRNALNFNGIFSKLFGSLFAKTSADEGSYKFGFPKYGFSEADMNNPLVEDPYLNAEEVAKLLEHDSKENDSKLIKRAEKCFGVILSDGEDGWQVDLVDNPDGDPEKDVIPTTLDYKNANCAEKSDNWLRLRMFIFDSRTMDAYMCIEGENEACVKAGIDGGETATEDASGNSTNATITNGSARKLAEKLLKYRDEGKYKCDNAEDCDDLELMAAGKSISCSSKSCNTYQACVASALDKRVLQVIIYLIDKDYKIGTYALCRAHSKTSGVHDLGKAVDISSINGETLSDGAGPKAKRLALEVNKVLFDLKGEVAVKQLITGSVGNKGNIDPDFVKYNRQAPGVEGAKAVAIYPGVVAGHDNHIHVGY